MFFSVGKMVIGFLNCLFRCLFSKASLSRNSRNYQGKFSIHAGNWKLSTVLFIIERHNLSRTLDKLLYMFLELIAQKHWFPCYFLHLFATQRFFHSCFAKILRVSAEVNRTLNHFPLSNRSSCENNSPGSLRCRIQIH